MLSKVRKIGTNTMYYGLGNILNKSLGFILIPIYTKHILIGQYGVLAILELIIVALLALLNFGITSGHERFFYREKDNKEYGKFLFSNMIGLLIRPQISMLFWSKTDYSFLLLLVIIITFVEINNIIPFQVLQYEGKPRTYIITNLSRLLISVFATLYFVVSRNLGIEGLLYGRLLGSGLTMLFQFGTVILPRLTFSFDFSKVSMTMKYGFPMSGKLVCMGLDIRLPI